MKTSIRRQGTWVVVAALAGSSVLGLLAQGPQASPYKPSRPIAIVGGMLIDGTGAPARHDQTVIIEGERITRVGPMESVTVPTGAEVIDDPTTTAALRVLMTTVDDAALGALGVPPSLLLRADRVIQ